jgi:hypothetical protein
MRGSATSSAPESAESAGEDQYATPQQIARLKLLAGQIGDDAYADVQDVMEHAPKGLPLSVYEVIKDRLEKRKQEAKSKAFSQGELA